MHRVELGDKRGRLNPGRQWLTRRADRPRSESGRYSCHGVGIEKRLTIEKFLNQCPVVSRVLGLQG